MKNETSKKILNKIKNSIDILFEIEKEIYELSLKIAKKLKKGEKGRVVFIGAGIASELAKVIIDELWFTFQIDSKKFVALTAAKDYENVIEQGEWKKFEEIASAPILQLDSINLTKEDLVICLSASGKTQYIKYAMKYAHEIGCLIALITDFEETLMNKYVDIKINTQFGPSILIGLNAADGGTIQKIVLDLLIYNSMEILGRIWKGHLVYIRPSSKKIMNDCIRIICEIVSCSFEYALKLFQKNNNELETAIVSELLKLDYQSSRKVIENNDYDFNRIFNTNT
ncbi:MAG: hypothetical protein TYPL_0910 [Candidatus Tyloplasma litorale]|nr:MAG: hypothetical protein TYPL_0910 [Mycoplasmatales bacterium]